MALTDTAIRRAVPQLRPYKLYDAGGMFVYVSPAGGKSFRLKYRFDGKEKLLTLGRYPVVTLALARERALQARRDLDAGLDPGVEKIAPAAILPPSGPTFKTVTRDWHKSRLARWSKVHADDVLSSMERDLFPAIGDTPIADVTVPQLLAAIRAVEERPAVETAHRQRQRAEAVFAFAIASGFATTNPAAAIRGALAAVPPSGKQPAILTLGGAREVYAAVAAQRAQPETVAAHQFLALTAQRSADVRGAAWEEMEGLDGPSPLWRIPVARMKGSLATKAVRGAVHLVPLTPAAVAIIEGIRPLTGHAKLLFGTPRFPDRPLSDNALGYLVQRAGFAGRHVPHGWRSTFSTILNERHPEDRRIIDLMLAHKPKDDVEAAYNRALYMERRRELANEWAEILT